MAYPATPWYLPGGKMMVVNRGGTIYAVSDADECCCEATTTTTTTPGYPCDDDCPDTLTLTLTGGDCGLAGDYTFHRNYEILGSCTWWSTQGPPDAPPRCGGSISSGDGIVWYIGIGHQSGLWCQWYFIAGDSHCPSGTYTLDVDWCGHCDASVVVS